MDEVDELKERLSRMKRKGDMESVIAMLQTMSSLMPPSEDFAISLGKRGQHEYLLDRGGPLLVTMTQEEYLPFLTGNQRRIRYDQIPEDVIRSVMSRPREVLDQLRDIYVEQSKRENVSSKLDRLVAIIMEFV
ncbi:hypothetical protein HS1genome_2153 [Sulfodiicoccus acidiphilus]|uniref:Uncharacterized protein n=1 Tax=Sulfodiicoccus acidiphilus TaxID=1670455 RepID=A0A348B6G2_9CREN|nr:hypothetical protein [Sulfodiicoccus acidiphilus]BBD73764.1 hypothetical protein HS1genome_2153 [Sulfodiicoccus acidiphilus]GGT98175.1 hypothetical protein GCM10007116_14690 [Sulfodiicoccus acidiphilus]